MCFMYVLKLQLHPQRRVVVGSGFPFIPFHFFFFRGVTGKVAWKGTKGAELDSGCHWGYPIATHIEVNEK